MRNKVLQVFRKRGEPEPGVVFDVGSNVGQSIREFRAVWPHARIYGFEPVRATFDKLAAATNGDFQITVTNAGASRRPGSAVMTSRGASTGNHIIPGAALTAGLEEVPLICGDDFAAERGIDEIGFLKVDAEGHDLDALAGFSTMLREGRIRFVQVEVGVSPDNLKCVPLDRVCGFMFAMGYRLLGLYGFLPLATLRRRQPGRTVADYADAVFVAPD